MPERPCTTIKRSPPRTNASSLYSFDRQTTMKAALFSATLLVLALASGSSGLGLGLPSWSLAGFPGSDCGARGWAFGDYDGSGTPELLLIDGR